MSERWFDQRWWYNPAWGRFEHMRAGNYAEEISIPEDAIDVRLDSRMDIAGLIALLEEQGYIKPRLDDRLRAEDLKITHRLIDLLEKD